MKVRLPPVVTKFLKYMRSQKDFMMNDGSW